MGLNLITDAWIPVRLADGGRRVVAPEGIAEPDVVAVDWPRADLNLACLELLVGLVLLADPPRDLADWRARRGPDRARLAGRLAPFAPAFELLGEGPRFLQDREELPGAGDGVDMLFIDSAGASTAKKNADLLPHRARYGTLDLPLAAMALYTLQAFAPSGGAGNRTSMRGGGPMVTLVDPGQGLWPLVWANVPGGAPATMEALPWMRPTRTSEKGQQVFPVDAAPVEAFFGMPRRLRLIGDADGVTGVRQRPYGTNYAGWEHPASPHYRQKAGGELLPVHPKPGLFGYRNWLGIVYRESGGLRHRAPMVEEWARRRPEGERVRLLVGGWAMSNMTAQDFIWSSEPLVPLDEAASDRLEGMIEAARIYAAVLRRALEPLTADGTARDAVQEAFFARTQGTLDALLTRLAAGEDPARDWLAQMRRVALDLFDARALPLLSQRGETAQREIVARRGQMSAAFAGYGKTGVTAWDTMQLIPPAVKRKDDAA